MVIYLSIIQSNVHKQEIEIEDRVVCLLKPRLEFNVLMPFKLMRARSIIKMIMP